MEQMFLALPYFEKKSLENLLGLLEMQALQTVDGNQDLT